MPHRTPDELLAQTGAGDAAAWGELLEHYRSYLTLLAEHQIGARLRVKADPTDLVQEALLQAHRAFHQFRGATAAAFLDWLQEILASRLTKLVRRYYGTLGRNVRLERDLQQSLADSSRALDQALCSPDSTPSGRAAGREEAVRVAAALDRLSPDHRRVIVLRQLEGLPFARVGEMMDRSEDAVTKLWMRAIGKLREALGGT